MSFRSAKSVFVAAGLCLALVAGWWMFGSSPSADEQKQQIRQLMLQKAFEEAQPIAEDYLQRWPDDAAVRFSAARIAEQLNQPEQADQHLQRIPMTGTADDADVLVFRASLQLEQLRNLAAAAQLFQEALVHRPDDVQILTELARLYAVCGRRRDSLPHILKLVQLGQASDLLLVAARPSGAINDQALLQEAYPQHHTDPLVLTGLAMLAARSDQLQTAVEHCRQAVQADPFDAAAYVMLGEYLLQAKAFDDLDDWQRNLNDAHDDYPESWRVRGYLAEHSGDRQKAFEFFLEAVRRGPDLKDVHHRLAQLLYAGGHTDDGNRFSKRLQKLQELEAAQDRVLAISGATESRLLALIEQFENVGRMWEAYGWCQMAVQTYPGNRPLTIRLRDLQQRTAELNLRLVPSDRTVASDFAGKEFDLGRAVVGPLSDLPENALASAGDGADGAAVQLTNEAAAVGFDFSYHNGVAGSTEHRMFELTGGGIAAADFDGDGYPDLFCTQGGLWSDRGTSRMPSDQLFRNRRGAGFDNESLRAGITDTEFGQGVAAGDINGDGFVDLVVANFGSLDLWLNNGDGTFSIDHRWTKQTGDLNRWWTSVMIANLDDQPGADVYAVGYLGGSDIAERTCPAADGTVQQCPPTIFDGVANVLLTNDSDGSFTDRSTLLTGDDDGRSLGVLAWSPNNDGKLAVFVANDTTPNHLFRSVGEQGARDEAFASGVATNQSGKSEGCMGIAIADLNYDGRLDLLVTNFLNESNTLYQPLSEHFFQDATDAWGLAELSLPVLGFGAQFVDINLDGFPELFVANGHVDDLRKSGRPYQMPAQLLQSTSRVFTELSGRLSDDYFHTDHLGRAVARLDWNRDGLSDLAVGHLQEPYALLTGQSDRPGNFLQLRLVGGNKHRESIGATVSGEIDGRLQLQQVTAGDGYQCSNERLLTFGCGDLPVVEELTVVWPDGSSQKIGPLPTDQRYAIVQGRIQAVLLPE